MPKKLKVSPNERVDIPDFLRAANDYTSETAATHAQKVLIGDRGYVLEGFRVQIINDAGNPAKIVVFNGNALNPDGTRLHNEADPAYAQEITLTGGSTTFYIEIIFVENDSEEDARAFWDPTIDNVSPIPDGREFDATVVTRTTPTWRVVRPVSTTGFEHSLSTPDSVKLPLVRLRTEGNNTIIGASNPGLSTNYPATVTEDDFDPAVNAAILKVADARLFSASTDNAVTIDPNNLTTQGTQAAIVAQVDAENNRLIMTANITGSYPAGTVVQATGRTQEYMVERTDGVPPANQGAPSPGTSLHPDNAARLWQGNEIRGSGLAVSKEDGTQRDDLNLKTLKDRVDFMSAQIREMKWGSLRVGEDGVEAGRTPPTSFDILNTSPRYFDKSRGIEAAATFVFTVGDGANSFGDFNAADETAIQAAIDAASANDTIFIKNGTYTLATSTITVDKSLTFIGDGLLTSIVSTLANTPCFTMTAGTDFDFRSLGLIASNNQGRTIEVQSTAVGAFSIENCLSVGSILVGPDTANMSLVRCVNNIITPAPTASGTMVMFGGETVGTAPSSIQVIIRDNVISTVAEGIVTHFDEVDVYAFENNFWQMNSTDVNNPETCILVFGDNAIKQGRITNNFVQGLESGNGIVGRFIASVTSNVWNLVIDGVTLIDGGFQPDTTSFIELLEFFNLEVRNIYTQESVTVNSATASFMNLGELNSTTPRSGNATVPCNLIVENCHIAYGSTSPGIGLRIGLSGSAEQNSTIRNVTTEGCVTGVDVRHVGRCLIENCFIDGGAGGTSSHATTGISLSPGNGADDTVLEATVKNTTIRNMKFTNAPIVAGIVLNEGQQDDAILNVTIDNCTIRDIGDAGQGVVGAVIGIHVADGCNFNRLTVTHTDIFDIEGAVGAFVSGISVFGDQRSLPTEPGVGINIESNHLVNIGSGSNQIVGIAVQLNAVGSGELLNCRILNNVLVNLISTGIPNYGIRINQANGSISFAKISGNTLFGVGGAFSVFGSQIDIITNSILNVDICTNLCFPGIFVNGTGASCTVVINEPTTGGTCQALKICDNTFIGGIPAGGNGTIFGILLFGVVGVDPDDFTIWDDLLISGNTVQVTQTNFILGEQHLIQIIGFLEGVRIIGNSTKLPSSNFNPAWGHYRINGVDVNNSSGIVISSNTGFGVSNGDWDHPQVSINDIEDFAITGNVWNFNQGVTSTGAGLINLVTCVDGTITGNVIRQTPNVDDVAMDTTCSNILGSGNNFGAGPGAATVAGTDTAKGLVFTIGDAAAVLATGPLNLHL